MKRQNIVLLSLILFVIIGSQLTLYFDKKDSQRIIEEAYSPGTSDPNIDYFGRKTQNTTQYESNRNYYQNYEEEHAEASRAFPDLTHEQIEILENLSHDQWEEIRELGLDPSEAEGK